MPRRPANPLAYAVLAQLIERPMHPYEMAAQMRQRRIQEVIRLNFGSLYTVVAALERDGYVVPRETVREGRRPERTVYAVTPAGRAVFREWLRDVVGTPTHEYYRFAAGLSFLVALPPDEAVDLLEGRADALAAEVAAQRDTLEWVARAGVARLFVIEVEYGIALREAEIDWVRRTAAAIREGALEGVDQWRAFQARGKRGKR